MARLRIKMKDTAGFIFQAIIILAHRPLWVWISFLIIQSYSLFMNFSARSTTMELARILVLWCWALVISITETWCRSGGKKLSSSELPRQGGVGGHHAPVAARHGAGQCDSPTKSHATNCIRPVRRTSTTTALHCSNSWRSVKQLCLFCFLWDCRICVST